MKFLGSEYVRRFNRETKRDGPLFRSRFKAIVIDADAYLVEVSRYIHRNPVEANLCKKPSEYIWSSYLAYENPRMAPSWLKTQEILANAGAKDWHQGYCKYVESDRIPSMRDFYNSRRLPGVLGSKEFRHHVSGLGFPDAAPRTVKSAIPIRTIIKEVARLYRQSDEEILRAARGKGNPGRLVALHVSDGLGIVGTEIAEHFGIKPAALYVTLSRLRQRAIKDSEFANRIKTAKASILGSVKRSC